MSQKNTLNILESIKNKINNFDRGNSQDETNKSNILAYPNSKNSDIQNNNINSELEMNDSLENNPNQPHQDNNESNNSQNINIVEDDLNGDFDDFGDEFEDLDFLDKKSSKAPNAKNSKDKNIFANQSSADNFNLADDDFSNQNQSSNDSIIDELGIGDSTKSLDDEETLQDIAQYEDLQKDVSQNFDDLTDLDLEQELKQNLENQNQKNNQENDFLDDDLLLDDLDQDVDNTQNNLEANFSSQQQDNQIAEEAIDDSNHQDEFDDSDDEFDDLAIDNEEGENFDLEDLDKIPEQDNFDRNQQFVENDQLHPQSSQQSEDNQSGPSTNSQENFIQNEHQFNFQAKPSHNMSDLVIDSYSSNNHQFDNNQNSNDSDFNNFEQNSLEDLEDDYDLDLDDEDDLLDNQQPVPNFATKNQTTQDEVPSLKNSDLSSSYEKNNGSMIYESTLARTSKAIEKLTKAKEAINYTSNFTKNGEIDKIAVQLMEPKIERWLNENLPEIVEQIVRDEIAKIVPKIEN